MVFGQSGEKGRIPGVKIGPGKIFSALLHPLTAFGRTGTKVPFRQVDRGIPFFCCIRTVIIIHHRLSDLCLIHYGGAMNTVVHENDFVPFLNPFSRTRLTFHGADHRSASVPASAQKVSLIMNLFSSWLNHLRHQVRTHRRRET